MAGTHLVMTRVRMARDGVGHRKIDALAIQPPLIEAAWKTSNCFDSLIYHFALHSRAIKIFSSQLRFIE